MAWTTAALVLALTSDPGGATWGPAGAAQDLRDRLHQLEAAAPELGRLSGELKRANAAAESARKSRGKSAQQKKLDEGIDAILRRLEAEYPDHILLWLMPRSPVPKNLRPVEEVRWRIREALARLNADHACASRAEGASVPSCPQTVEDCSSEGFGVDRGELYVENLTREAEVERARPTPPEMTDGAAAAARWSHYRYLRCQSLAHGGATFAPTAITGTPFADPEWISSTGYVTNAAELGKYCSPSSGLVEKLERLSRIRKDWAVRHWYDRLEQQRTRCVMGTADICSGVYFVRGTPALAYVTRACEVRRVTAQDVRADIERAGNVGVTQADQLQHEELIDVLEACAAASKAGYTWQFAEPRVPPRCKKPRG